MSGVYVVDRQQIKPQLYCPATSAAGCWRRRLPITESDDKVVNSEVTAPTPSPSSIHTETQHSPTKHNTASTSSKAQLNIYTYIHMCASACDRRTNNVISFSSAVGSLHAPHEHTYRGVRNAAHNPFFSYVNRMYRVRVSVSAHGACNDLAHVIIKF